MRVNFLRITCTVASALLLAACTQDDVTDGNALPEGKYPLEIASVAVSVEGSGRPWTRVAETSADGMSSAWEWNGTERIGVQLYADGETAVYTLNTDKSLTPDKTLYWKNTQQTTVTAWYPAYEGGSGTVSLGDQSKKLAYVLAGTGNGSYQQPVELTFNHALAKVRVVLQGDQAEKVTNIQIKSFISCTHTQGEVSTESAQDGWITMMPATYNGTQCWEANVVPGIEITQVQLNGAVKYDLSTTVMPEKGKVHRVEITVGKPLNL